MSLLNSLRRFLAPASLPALLIALVVTVPILIILGSVFLDSAGIWQHLRTTVLPEYLKNSLLLSLGVGLGSVLIGLPAAWLVAMYRFPGRRAFEWLLLLPLAMPTYLMAYTYTDFLEFAGPVQTWFRQLTGLGIGEYWFPEIRSLSGAVIIFSFVLYPYVYLFCRAAFLEQSICVIEASRTMGRTPWQCLHSIGLPLARPALVGGVALVVMESLADYGAVDYFAIDTFTTGIYRTWAGLGSPVGAAQLSALLLVLVFLILAIERLSRGPRRFFHTTTRYRAIPAWTMSRPRQALAICLCLIPLGLGFLLPVGVLANLAIQEGITRSDFLAPVRHSSILAGSTALLAVCASLVLAYSKRQSPGRLRSAIHQFASLGYAVPGSVIAIGVMLALGEWDGLVVRLGFGPILGGTVAGLIFAYLVRFLAVALNSIEAGFQKINPSLDQAGRTLRAGTWRLLARVHFPLLRSSALAAGILVFVDVLKELPATLIIRPFNFDTLAVRVYQLAGDERLAEAAVPALLIVGVGLLPVVILSRMISSSRPGQEVVVEPPEAS